MKAIYAFITKANQVLFFLAALAAVCGIGYLVYDETHHNVAPPHVTVTPTDGTPAPTIVRDVRFLHRKDGVYIFGIVKREVSAPPSSGPKLGRVFGSGDAEPSGEIVNIVFSNSEGPIRSLLANDGLVLSHQLSGQYEIPKAHFHAFLCVTEDTDGNHVLDRHDRQDLYIVRDTLKSPDIVIRSVSSFDITSDDDLVVQTNEKGSIHFWAVDVATSAQKEIAWK